MSRTACRASTAAVTDRGQQCSLMTGRVPRDGPHSEQLYSGSLAEHEKEAGRAAQAARGMTQEQVATRMGVSVARVSQIESGDVSTQDVLNRYVSALGGTLKLIADFGDEQLKIA